MHNYALSLYLQLLGCMWGRGRVLTFAPVFCLLCYQPGPASQAGALGKEKCLNLCQNPCPCSLAKPGFWHVSHAAHDFPRQVTFFCSARMGVAVWSFLSFPVADVTTSNFLCLLWGENSQVLHSSRFVQKQACVSRCPSDIWASLDGWSSH